MTLQRLLAHLLQAGCSVSARPALPGHSHSAVSAPAKDIGELKVALEDILPVGLLLGGLPDGRHSEPLLQPAKKPHLSPRSRV